MNPEDVPDTHERDQPQAPDDQQTRDDQQTPDESTPAEQDAPMSSADLRAALEAILLVVDEPAAETVLAEALDQPVARVTAVLEELSGEYTAEGRGFDLRRAAGGWRLYTRAEQAAHVERFVLDGQQARLSQAALETLAVVAYQQPVTRSRVAAVRGVNCDGVMRTLLTRGLVEESGTEPETGARLYCTTTVFLEKLGLDSVAQLPPLAPFLPEDVAALDPDRRASATAVDGTADSTATPDGATPATPDSADTPAPDSVDTPDLDEDDPVPAPAPREAPSTDGGQRYAAGVEEADAAG